MKQAPWSLWRNWLRSLWSTPAKRKRPRRPSLRLEPLEDRIAPAVSALADFPFVDVGASTTFNVLTNDSNPDGTGLAVLSSTAVAPGGPTLTDNGDGTFTFLSAATGTFSFDYTVTGAENKIVASDAAAGDFFGFSVAVSGDTVVVGAHLDDNGGGDSGSAYVFTLDGGVWTLQQKLTASDGAAGDWFGYSVGVSGDTAVVGAFLDDDGGSDSGSAYVFTRSGVTWTQQQKLTASDAAAFDYFGRTVAVDGDTVVVGAQYDDDAGSDAGSAYVFTRSGVVWTQQQKLLASDAAAFDRFASSVAVSGDTVVVGAVYDDDGGGNSGSTYVFTRSGGVWTPQQKLAAADAAAADFFGYSVTVSGDTIVVGAPQDDDGGIDSGSAYVFTRNAGTWTQQQKLTASDAAADDRFGASVGVSGDVAVIGAVYDDDGGSKSGSAYVFTRSGVTWTEQQKLVASDAAADDRFGSYVGVSGDTVVVGAVLDDDGGSDSGSAYIRNVTQAAATVTVTVTNTNPVFTSPSAFSVAENTTAVGSVTATDADVPAQVITYTISGGADQSKFTINSGTGALRFLTAPNFEAPNDSDSNNVYLVQVTASDGYGGSAVQDIAVTVTDVSTGTFFLDVNNQLCVFDDDAGLTNTGGYAITLSAGVDANGHAQVYFLDGNHQLWRYDQGVFTNTGGYAKAIFGGQREVFFLDGNNQIYVYQDTGTFLATGGYALSLSVGRDSLGNDEVWFRDGVNQIWRYRQGAFFNTGGYGIELVAGRQGEVTFRDGNNQLWIFRDAGGFINTGGYASALGSGGTDSLGNDEISFLDGNRQVWKLNSAGQFTATGGYAEAGLSTTARKRRFGTTDAGHSTLLQDGVAGETFYLDFARQLYSGSSRTGGYATLFGVTRNRNGESEVFFLNNDGLHRYDQGTFLFTGAFAKLIEPFMK